MGKPRAQTNRCPVLPGCQALGPDAQGEVLQAGQPGPVFGKVGAEWEVGLPRGYMGSGCSGQGCLAAPEVRPSLACIASWGWGAAALP